MNNEIWKDIKGFEGFYQISNLGRVKSLGRQAGRNKIKDRIMSIKTSDPKKYEKVGFTVDKKAKYFKVHQLVARAFIELPDTVNYYEVNHIDGNRHNNKVENLEWVTRLQNNHHKFKLGTVLLGSKHQNSKIDEKQAREIKIMLRDGFLPKEISKELDLSVSIVYSIRKGETWKQVTI